MSRDRAIIEERLGRLGGPTVRKPRAHSTTANGDEGGGESSERPEARGGGLRRGLAGRGRPPRGGCV